MPWQSASHARTICSARELRSSNRSGKRIKMMNPKVSISKQLSSSSYLRLEQFWLQHLKNLRLFFSRFLAQLRPERERIWNFDWGSYDEFLILRFDSFDSSSAGWLCVVARQGRLMPVQKHAGTARGREGKGSNCWEFEWLFTSRWDLNVKQPTRRIVCLEHGKSLSLSLFFDEIQIQLWFLFFFIFSSILCSWFKASANSKFHNFTLNFDFFEQRTRVRFRFVWCLSSPLLVVCAVSERWKLRIPFQIFRSLERNCKSSFSCLTSTSFDSFISYLSFPTPPSR